jgi:spermidine/putrescine transport system ATP-binding protein/putrescine transport system ATP-binding protein
MAEQSGTARDPAGDKRVLVRFENVSKRFGALAAVDDLSLDIYENEFFALLGPSGCGKTTLLRILAGFEAPDSGTVRLGGADLLALPPERRPVNLMFQSYALFPHMSVEKNVAYGLEREGRPRDEVRARVAEVLRTVGIAETATRRPSQLSGGQRQRVALARAIVKRPRLLLLDEPLSALDRKVREEMQLELKRLQHEVGITFVVVTHDQEEAMSMADRIAVMRRGRLEQLDGPVDLYERPRSLFVARFIGSNNLFEGVAAEDGIDVVGIGRLPAADVGMAPGAPAWLGVRPEHVRIVGAGAGPFLAGTVAEVEFQGGMSTVAVQVAGLPRPILVSVPGVARVARDATVGLTWDPAATMVLPAE